MKRNALFFTVFAIGGFLLLTHAQPSTENALAEELAQLPTHPLITDQPQLQWYIHLQTIDPIFAFPADDLALFNENFEVFLDNIWLLKELYPSDQTGQNLIDQTLYPTNFLRGIYELETARNALLLSPSIDTATKHKQQLDYSIVSYQDYLRNLIAEIEANPEALETYALWGGTITAESLLAALRALEENATYQQERADARYNCLSTWHTDCQSIKRTLTQNADTVHGADTSDAAPREITETTAEILEAFATFHPDNETPSRVYTLRKNWCTPSSTEPQLAVYNTRTQERPDVATEIVSDLFFHDTGASKSPFLQFLGRNNVPFEYQGARAYSCTDSMPLILRPQTLDVLITEINEAPFSQSELVRLHLTQEQYERLIALENTIASSTVVYESDVSEILQILLTLLTTNGAVLDHSTYTDITDLYLRYITDAPALTTIPLIPLQANAALNDSSRYEDFAHVSPSASLLINRSFAHFLLFPFNPTVLKNPISFYDAKYPVRYPEDNMLRVYIGDVENEYSVPALFQMMQRSLRVTDEL